MSIFYQQRPPQRVGTRGFRAPEVVLRSINQGVAVDIWAVGIIALCIFSGKYPFFQASDEADILAELCLLFGTKQMEEGAAAVGKVFSSSAYFPPCDLISLCNHLHPTRLFPLGPAAADFLHKLLSIDPSKRPTAIEALSHPWLHGEE
ncbi:MAG: putative protein kinase [Streblomastix strix]|uniref:Protein kinase domain-containing protein n=1 Tax=Streblomastix strix TaxID=222440 RepID=A0A5J4V7X8_9EUKA|nr:MAG: putative protein kinase [Streblomastix strix]